MFENCFRNVHRILSTGRGIKCFLHSVFPSFFHSSFSYVFLFFFFARRVGKAKKKRPSKLGRKVLNRKCLESQHVECQLLLKNCASSLSVRLKDFDHAIEGLRPCAQTQQLVPAHKADLACCKNRLRSRFAKRTRRVARRKSARRKTWLQRPTTSRAAALSHKAGPRKSSPGAVPSRTARRQKPRGS